MILNIQKTVIRVRKKECNISSKNIAVKMLSALLRQITSKLIVIMIVWIFPILLEQKINLNCIKKYWKRIFFCNVIMPSEDTEILELNQYRKYDKVPFIIYSDLNCIIENIDGSNNPENSSTTKVSEHIPSSFSMSTISSFRSIENKHNDYKRLRENVLWILKKTRNEDN